MTEVTMLVKSTIASIEFNGVMYARMAIVKDDGHVIVAWAIENQGKDNIPLPQIDAERMEAAYAQYMLQLNNSVGAERVL